MTSCLSKLKVTPSFCFAFKIPDDPTASNYVFQFEKKDNETVNNFHWRWTVAVADVDAATSSGILKAKQKLGRTFDSNKLGGIAFAKISKLTMCSA